jgi:hypothetical protein
MARNKPLTGPGSSDNGYRVELPRTCDAIGVVLRDAFERDLGLPDDMLLLLRKINGRPATSRDC